MLDRVELSTRVLGRVHEHHACIDSTNLRAAQWAGQGAPHGAVVTADEQTAGRGRRGRRWYSPPGAHLYATVVLRPPRPGPELGPLALVVGLGLRDGLTALGVDVGLKWPNDLLAGGRKLGGILCEARWSGAACEVAAGFGINVGAASFPDALADVATSLHHVLGSATPERVEVLAAILGGLEPVLDRFFADGFAPLADRYRAACVTLGRTVTLGSATQPAGVAARIDDAGALWIRPADGGPPQRVLHDDVWLTPTA